MNKDRFVDMINNKDYDLFSIFKETYIESLKLYFLIGGMPEAVNNFINTNDLNEVRSIQHKILDAYEQDFSKHAPIEIVPKLRMIWNNIPSQLAKENKKFIYGLLREGARAKDYEVALMWLSDCGLVHQINRISTPKIPLKAYIDLKSFKLFLLDVGLLSCLSDISPKTVFKW